MKYITILFVAIIIPTLYIDNQGSRGEVILDNSENPIDPNAPKLPNESKVFDFTINGISDTPGPVEYKICGV